MKTAEYWVRAIQVAPTLEGAAALLRQAAAESLVAPGGHVTPEELAGLEALLGNLRGDRPPSAVRRALAEVRRLWAVLGDAAQDSAMYRHGFGAGWRACREAAAARLDREAAGCAENLAALEAAGAAASMEAFVESACRNTCERLAARVRATEPPAAGGVG
jgi:hypothetical protein